MYLTERLRRAAAHLKPADEIHVTSTDLDNAADEIERLSAALSVARTALLNIEKRAEEARAQISKAQGLS